MKNFILLLSLISAGTVFADTTLVCCDQNSHSIYKLTINENKLLFSPIVKDSSILSENEINLRYNEGESSEKSQIFSGKLARNNNIVIELLKEDRNIIEGNILFSDEDSSVLNKKTTILCSHE